MSNIAKNPLLSSAVTGLSIEDLTHHAVLLPVAQPPAQNTEKDHSEPHHDNSHKNITLTNLPSGDSNLSFKLTPSNQTPILGTQTIKQYDNLPPRPKSSVSKASVKSEDDFDVNEYFARLQGTRYVSAPINLSKDEQNANLKAAEENLEEINLNEPDKQNLNDEHQQSFTADIAQNFSQLPTVLPQVASAVFSSFSSILSYRSREQTPDGSLQPRPQQWNQETQMENVGMYPVEKVESMPYLGSMPAMGSTENSGSKEVAPPPKEPPIAGPGNFRITTKKKAYAQIPGLSTSFAGSVQHFNPLTASQSNAPSYFIPPPKSGAPAHNDPTGTKEQSFCIPPTMSVPSQTLPPQIQGSKEQPNVPSYFIPPPPVSVASAASQEPLKESQSSKEHSSTPSSFVLPPTTGFATPSQMNAPPMQANNDQFSSQTVFIPSQLTDVPVLSHITPSENQRSKEEYNVPSHFAKSHDSASIEIFESKEKYVALGHGDYLQPGNPTTEIKTSQSRSNDSQSTVSFFNPENIFTLAKSTSEYKDKEQKITSAASTTSNAQTQQGLHPLGIAAPPQPSPIIPPPPMFSNLKNENPPSVGKSVLPPSVARRISAYQPMIKPEVPAATSFDNIFIPTLTEPQLSSDVVSPPNAFEKTSVPYKAPSDSENINQPSAFAAVNLSSSVSVFNPMPSTSQAKSETTVFTKSHSSSSVLSPHLAPINVSQTPVIEACQMQQPAFFNPLQQQLNQENNLRPAGNTVQLQYPPAQSSLNATVDPAKPLTEPPKASCSLNFRLTKKRPQYYAGPIEGVGAISNNVKPVIPNVSEDSFQGSVFSPDQDISQNANQQIFHPNIEAQPSLQSPPTATNIEQASVPFDITKPSEMFPSHELNNSSQSYGLPDYNSSFDLSRSTNEAYEDTMNENKGFGLIGSLKSKLGSIDINKIQNSVTTFFDPAYNITKSEEPKHDLTAYDQQQMQDYSRPSYAQDHSFDLFVTQGHPISQPYGNNYQNIYNQNCNQQPQNYQNYCQEQNQNYPTFYSNMNFNSFQQENLNVAQDETINEPYSDYQNTSSGHISNTRFFSENMENIDSQNKNEASALSTENSFAPLVISVSYKDNSQEPSAPVVPSTDFFQTHFGLPQLPTIDSENDISKNKIQPDEKQSSQEIIEAEVREDSFNRGDKVSSCDMFNAARHDNVVFETHSSQNIFDKGYQAGTLVTASSIDNKISTDTALENIEQALSNVKLENKLDQDQSISCIKSDVVSPQNEVDFDICATCREVNQQEQQEGTDTLTAQLIENITSPIQLLNPVEVPLPESIKNDEMTQNFDSDQCAQITHITEETIELLHAHSAHEMLDAQKLVPETSNYGWVVEDTYQTNNTISAIEQSGGTTITVSENNSQVVDNVPNNASDEIKAELKSSQEDFPILLREMSVPTAPPIEDFDDTKSDGTGILDVHSIEQDAKNDFPLDEEYVIEPSGTDDDKIEFEKKRSSEDPVEDSFTNRVENFKKREEVAHHDIAFDTQTNIQIANIPIASYFDTGNYATEKHNQGLLMTSTLSPSHEPAAINPSQTKSIDDLIKVPNCSTQTRTSPTLTISKTQTSKSDSSGAIRGISQTCDQITNENITLPSFNKVFGSHRDVLERNVPFATEIPKPASSMEKQQVSDNFVINDSIKTQSLPDPQNFFEPSDEPSAPDNSFNRLASYFGPPPKDDQKKSFFELSQSQDHYRHKTDDSKLQSGRNSDTFSLQNIPKAQYITNFNLMKDLATHKDHGPPDRIYKNVNYFTVEYDNRHINDFLKPQLHLKNTTSVSNARPIELNEWEPEENSYDKNITSIFNNCKHCCYIFSNINGENIKIKKAMDNNLGSESKGVSMELNKEGESKSVNISLDNAQLGEQTNQGLLTATEHRVNVEYAPVKHHWFYRVDREEKSVWKGFSVLDSQTLEDAFHSPTLNESTVVPTDGGRFDVNVVGRLRVAVFWAEKPANVRRCSWFYKGNTDARYVPYKEDVAEKLEEEYRLGIATGVWHRKLSLPNSEMVIMHGPSVMVHLLCAPQSDAFTQPNSTPRPRVVRRGIDESEIEDTEPSNIDHLLLMCHGVGSACDMQFRSVEKVVDDFRTTSLQLIQSHYRNSFENGIVGRVEVLPISWHATLHSGENGVDHRLARITLDSIPILRNFTNDTILDALFYTSPIYCQTITDIVCKEINRIYQLFCSRNPNFKGGVSLGGHSLGSLILYDLLCHQPIPKDLTSSHQISSVKKYVNGSASTGHPTVKYPTLDFSPVNLFAMGSPIAMFESVRGVESLGKEFSLPSCRGFFNIFHPYDPIAYRIEPLIDPELKNVKPYLIPHHKGRKRMHLELKDTMFRVGADLKIKLLESIKATWASIWKSQPPPSSSQLEKVVEEELEKEQLAEESKEDDALAENAENKVPPEMLGKLNGGRRIDYVLQEAPFEIFNEYIFAMRSHLCYWESEDTMLLILREVYDAMGVQPDSCVPQQSLTVQRTRIVKDDDAVYVPISDHASTSKSPT